MIQMPFFQLKPLEESFLKICRNIVRLDLIILCEGNEDVETLKALTARIPIQMTSEVGITDCEGYPTIREIAQHVATIARTRKRLKRVSIIIDANNKSFEQRFQSIIDFFTANGLDVTGRESLSKSSLRLQTESIEIIVKIAGIMTLPFKKHMMEDHAVKLLLDSGKVKNDQLTNFEDAKAFLDHIGKKSETIIGEAEISLVRQTYEEFIDLLNL